VRVASRSMTSCALSVHAIGFLIAALIAVHVRADPTSTHITIYASEDGRCTVLSDKVPCETVGLRLLDAHIPPTQLIVLSGSPNATYHIVGAALQSLQFAGFVKIQFPNK
jgi:biopolymer transport protein ExbD